MERNEFKGKDKNVLVNFLEEKVYKIVKRE